MPMCRNIRTLYNFDPPASEDEVRAAALQYVRKVSGFTKPSRANQAAFDRAVDRVAAASVELLHELQVHQIELEMQNEELRRAQLALEDSRARYVDLYEFAPVGYLTLTGEAVISEVNLTGARLLREERKKILGKRFARFVSRQDQSPAMKAVAALRNQFGGHAVQHS